MKISLIFILFIVFSMIFINNIGMSFSDSKSTKFVKTLSKEGSNALLENEKSKEYITKIKGDVGFYNDPKGYCTVGYGHLVDKSKSPLSCEKIDKLDDNSKIKKMKEKLNWIKTPTDALKLYKADVKEFEGYVNYHLKNVPLTQDQFDAVFDFTFNHGPGHLEKLVKSSEIKDGNYADFAEKLRHYDDSDLKGLVDRSNRNADKFEKGIDLDLPEIILEEKLSDKNLSNHMFKEFYEKGLSLYEQGKFGEAIKYFDKALDINSEDMMTLYYKGDSYYGLDELDKANTYLMKALEKDKNNPAILSEIGSVLLKKGEYDRSIDYSKKALARDPNNLLANHDIGLALGNKGKFKEAIPYLKKAYQIDPDYVPVLDTLGAFLSETGKYEEAMKYLRRSLDIRPNSIDVLNYMGVCLSYLGRHVEAIDHYDRALKLLNKGQPLDGTFWFVYHKTSETDQLHERLLLNTGLSHNNMGNHKGAVQYYLKALKINPNNVTTLIYLALTYTNMGDYYKAIDYYEKALKIDPNNEFAKKNRYQLGEALRQAASHPQVDSLEFEQGQAYQQLVSISRNGWRGI